MWYEKIQSDYIVVRKKYQTKIERFYLDLTGTKNFNFYL